MKTEQAQLRLTHVIGLFGLVMLLVISIRPSAAVGDPALAALHLPGGAVAAGDVLTVTAVLVNTGRNPVSNITVKLYSGSPANRPLPEHNRLLPK